MLLSRLLALVAAASAACARPGAPAPAQSLRLARASDGLQTNVTWDQYSLMINGERMNIFSGEFHPYRMPVHSLYLDIFQKIKALGFNAVSFYTFWGLHEPKRGAGIDFSGFRNVTPFVEAAQEAGIYLIARPGPYINAETTAGGFPGWGTTDPAIWRTRNTTYDAAWQDYVAGISKLLAPYQITNGGPIILWQSENEYSGWQAPYSEDFVYEQELLTAWRANGIVVPTTHNDASPSGHYTSVNIWGYDSYPNGFDCSHPYTWSSGAVPEYLWSSYQKYAPAGVPNSIYEYQGGAFDGWGGSGYQTCAELLGPEFERVFYKDRVAQSTATLSLYMIYGGTNWGGIAHPGVYTSYDYGAAIAEDRTLREKYYELKLLANFLKVSPAYTTTRPQNIATNVGAFTGSTALKVTQTLDVVGNRTGFYVVRQADASSLAMQMYKITLPTSAGKLALPALGGSLMLTGRDSKIHVVDYAAGNTTLLYSTGEIATWATVDARTVVVLYGNKGETHETAVKFIGAAPAAKVVSGSGTIKTGVLNGTALAIQYTTTGETVVQVGSNLLLYIVERASAYEFWALSPPGTGAFAAFNTANTVLVKGGYLVRSVNLASGTVALTGDLNATAAFEVFAPATAQKVTFNGQTLNVTKSAYGTLLASKTASLPAVTLPTLQNLTWKSADSLPEISSSYSDAAWPVANKTSTANPTKPSTPVVLYGDEYGFHTGTLLWRAHFTATGTETGFSATVIGGAAFGYSVWLDGTFIGSWVGNAPSDRHAGSFAFASKLVKGAQHVVTIVQDHMGLEEDWTTGTESFKNPRGILAYAFTGSSATKATTWKVTGNLGGEDYVDRTRGPLNEGGLYAERQGWHLPGFDDSKWAASRPTDGIAGPGIHFYRTQFPLAVPAGVDYPLAIAVTNATATAHFRAQFYVNGYQFGKYVNAIGPQTSFPVPQGILNYNGMNTLAVSLWAHDAGGAKLSGLHVELRAQIESAMPAVVNQPMPAWSARPGAY